jgi:hypothetical protein
MMPGAAPPLGRPLGAGLGLSLLVWAAEACPPFCPTPDCDAIYEECMDERGDDDSAEAYCEERRDTCEEGCE